MSNVPLKKQEEEAGKIPTPHALLCEYLAEQLSEEAVKTRKERERKEFDFSLIARIILSIAVLVVVSILYWKLLQVAGDWSKFGGVSPVIPTVLISGIIIGNATLLSLLLNGVFRNADKNKPVHPMQSLLNNPEMGGVFKLSEQDHSNEQTERPD